MPHDSRNQPPSSDRPDDLSDPLARLWAKIESMPCDPLRPSPSESPTRPRRATPLDLGIPPIYRRARLDHFLPKDFESGAWLLAPQTPTPRSLFIEGVNGVGKTYLAAALAREWACRWCSTLKLLRRVRRSFKPGVPESEDQIIESFVDPMHLVLDDVTAAALTEFGIATVLGVLEERHNRARVTLVTCHHSLKKVDELDTSLASRLAGYQRVVLVGKDRRLG